MEIKKKSLKWGKIIMRTKPEVKLTCTNDIEFFVEKKPNFTFYTAEYWEIVLPVDGNVEISAEGRKRTIAKGNIVFICPTVKRRVTLRSEGGKLLSIRLSANVIKEVFDTFDSESYNCFKDQEILVRPIDELHANDIISSVESVHVSELELRNVLLKKLCYSIFLPLVPFRTYSGGGDVVQRTLNVMNDAANVGSRLPDIAAKVGCSEEYLVRCFKKQGLETPNTIFKRIKLRYAKSVLTSRKISVGEVSKMIGFRSVGHFNKLYMLEFGVCPGNDKTRK